VNEEVDEGVADEVVDPDGKEVEGVRVTGKASEREGQEEERS
jgi:hypothetical protein